MINHPDSTHWQTWPLKISGLKISPWDITVRGLSRWLLSKVAYTSARDPGWLDRWPFRSFVDLCPFSDRPVVPQVPHSNLNTNAYTCTRLCGRLYYIYTQNNSRSYTPLSPTLFLLTKFSIVTESCHPFTCHALNARFLYLYYPLPLRLFICHWYRVSLNENIL